MQVKPNILFLTPVIPANKGNGLAMRAGNVLKALAKVADVYMLILPHYACPEPLSADEIQKLCKRYAYLPPGGSILTMGDWVLSAARVWPKIPFDVVHHFRLATLPFGEPYLHAGKHRLKPRAHLDLDDVESLAHRRLAKVLRLDNRSKEAEQEEHIANQVEQVEDRVLSSFDRVYLCSFLDRNRLLARAKAELVVLPNVITVPEKKELKKQKDKEQPFTFLFVGTLGYFPNEDGIVSFCESTWSALLEQSPQPIQLNIVGTGPTPRLLEKTQLPNVKVIGQVADIMPEYTKADAVIVPLRIGGGTRIKILEAFAYQTPLVSTTLGIEGIEAESGKHFLLADSADDFTFACMQLIHDGTLREQLSANAYQLVKTSYSLNQMVQALK